MTTCFRRRRRPSRSCTTTPSVPRGKVAAETGDGEDPDDLPQLYAKKPKLKAKTNEAFSFEDDFSEEHDRFISDLIEEEYWKYWNDFYYNNYCDLDCFCS